MDNLDQLGDDELRLQLVQYGFPNLPVTSTTRKILIKKLRLYIEQQLRRDATKVARYSSGEESDGNDGRKAKTAAQRKSYATGTASASSASGASRTGRSQRATVGAAGAVSLPPPAPIRQPVTRVPISSISSPAPPSSASVPHSFAGANGAGPNHKRYTAPNSNAGSLSPSSGSSIYISPLIVHDSEEEDYTPPIRSAGVGGAGGSTSIRPFGNPSPPSTSHSSLFRKTALSVGNITPPSANSSMYSTVGAGEGNSSGGSALLNDSNGSNGAGSPTGSGTGESPYVSEYTKRLMQLRGETVSHENYNSAIGGIMGRRGVASSGAPRYSAPSSHLHPLRPLSSHQQPPSSSGGLLHHPLRPGHPHMMNSKGTAGLSASPLGTSGPIISGNHIRQRYGRLSGTHELNENDIVTHAQPSPDAPGVPFRVAIGNLMTKLDEHYGFKQTFIPCALLCLLVVFLLSVAFMYMTISTDLASTLSSIDTRYELCGVGADPTATTCVFEADVEPALELLKLIGNELKARVELHHCRRDGAATASSGVMSAGEALKYAKDHSPSVLIPQLSRHLHAMEYLIDRNPQWRINHCDANGAPITYDGVLQRRPSRSNHFTILKPKLPFTCMMYNKFQKFFMIVGGLALVSLIVFAGNYLLKFVLHVKQKRRDQVNGLISEILHAVSQAAANASDAATRDGGTAPKHAGVVINHLRDRLLGTTNRRRLDWAWNEALYFLEHHESRIAFEVGSVDGEDFKIMRWIDSAPLATGTPSAGASRLGGPSGPAAGGASVKKWQSPAFDNSNKIHDPPTPCLKIRQMFDKYEVNDPNLKTIVQDAILEKVAGRCKIYDIQLDRSSCCVYVRCASAKDAGIVHEEINGWWFDNRLVSIKFLRLERYLQRFPRSLAGPACLKPSNKNNASMSHQLALSNNGGPAGAGGRFAANGNRGNGRGEDLDTDPEEYDEVDAEEDDEEEDDEELVVAAANSNRRSVVRRTGRKSDGRRHDEDDEEDE